VVNLTLYPVGKELVVPIENEAAGRHVEDNFLLLPGHEP
jgi:hypothetical protein